MPFENETPRPRPLEVDAHILAYLGDFMIIFEQLVKKKAIEEIAQTPNKKKE